LAAADRQAFKAPRTPSIIGQTLEGQQSTLQAAGATKGFSDMIGGMILLVVAAGVFASAVAGMLNDGRRLP
jgi:hypothetical protein